MRSANPLEIGKAWQAHQAYNKHARKDLIKDFDLKRWLNVVHALNGSAKRPGPQARQLAAQQAQQPMPWHKNQSRRQMPSKKWTREHHQKFQETIKRRREAALA